MGSKVIQILLVLVLWAGELQAADGLKAYSTRYYTIYTDASPAAVREADVRMTKMAEEYQRRTRDFSAGMAGKLPFYLYRNEEDYLAAGGRPGTAGMFTGDKLMAVAGEQWTAVTWHVVQHEGFHQYARLRIGGLPIWVEEGLADYFGEALFTGDGYVAGVIPKWRLERVQQMIRGNRFRPLEDVMRYTPEDWNRDIKLDNYDQAWSMVQFLANGKGGKLQKPFEEYVKQVSHGRAAVQAWEQIFGTVPEFQEAWKQYWLEAGEKVSEEVYVQAAAQTFAAFLARAMEQGQKFKSFSDFAQAASSKKLRCREDLWLPTELLWEALEGQAETSTVWKLERKDGGNWLVVGEMEQNRRIAVKVVLPDRQR